ncbi:MAG: TonB-dependent receptor [Pyrinomonadaceae bacterium]|nr:TonB-dependent receptor [Pyrinomonadaceae bacterium]
MFKTSLRVFLLGILIMGLAIFSFGQSQALNGQIEGTVTDQNGASVPNATVTAKNIETGAERKVTTDESGVYRIPLLPLGSYQITIEAPNFKKYVQNGVILTTGRIATVSPLLQAGDVSATVTVTSDATIADPGKIDVGRVMNTREVENLPLVSRNPYNFSLLQANVTGRPNAEFGVPRINANGYARRTNYQLDGNNNTQADRGGIRLMPISETFVSEVQLVTNGFSAEFGNTPGLIMNAVTPSGTNDIHGSGSYRFRRTPFYARPFQYTSNGDIPKTKADNLTFAIGGPIMKDRWHYYGGYEYVNRDLTSESGRLVTISAANQAALIAAGVPSTAFVPVIPTKQKAKFYIFRTDAQLNEKNRVSVRYNYFGNNSPDNIGGGLNTLQRSITFIDASYSLGAQVASTITPNVFNEFRFQYAKRDSRNYANSNSGTGISIVITNVANFGAPENDDTIAPLQETTQFQDNLTWIKGDHTFKFGGGVNLIDDRRRANRFARYTFPTIQAFIDAKNGVTPKGYTNYIEAFGDADIKFYSRFGNFFLQDDWKVTRKLKLNYGVRYDIYDLPQADTTSPFTASQNFKIDKNNFAPRLGLVYSVREGNRPTVVRASAGIYYDTVYLDLYQRALLNNGSPRLFNFTFAPATAGSPSFPTTLGTLPAGSVLPQQSIETIASDFESMYAMHFNAQFEQALTQDLSVTVGYIHSGGRHIPIYRNINRINPQTTLADGRPIFSNTVNATTRRDTRFNNILMAESVGNSEYQAMTLQFNKRLSKGYQFSINYTLSKSEDDAPEQNLVATQVGNLVTQDPTNRKRDFGYSLADQRHTFVASFVGRPTFDFSSKALNSILNNNQFGIIATANNGERYNIVSATDINLDGFTGSDNPVGIARNSGVTPKQLNVDLRYSRFVNFSERYKLEIFGEFINVFNKNSFFQFNSLSVTTDAAGNLTQTIPTVAQRLAANAVTSLDARQFQLGFKFKF